MGAKRDDNELIGQLPGTGGDFIDPNDVEGHRASRVNEEPGQSLRARDADRTYPDVEGDVEGHLYHGGPTTQGEVIRRGPDDNPHGER